MAVEQSCMSYRERAANMARKLSEATNNDLFKVTC